MILSKLQLTARRPGFAGLYNSHKALWRLFGDHPDRKRDFLYRELAPLSFLCLSERAPEDRDGIWSIASKPFAPVLNPGDRLQFSARVNAVHKTRNAQGKQMRHDIVQHARMRLKAEGVIAQDMPSRPILAMQEGRKWFLDRQESFGLELDQDSFMIESATQHAFYKKESGKGQLSTLDMSGMARVTNVDLLLQALHQGIGSAKGFGCGLLLIRRA